ncbi:MAG: Holliday junction branch migration protein RuvA [Candidatus Ancillula sp.]|nr:Holliday junction branch migration protein RuvA [Candidatus Ancillula sp.]
MISFIRGEVLDLEIQDFLKVVVAFSTDTSTLGLTVIAPAALSQGLRIGTFAEFWVSNIVREDSNTLYGFATREEKKLFERLISVSSIGPRIGLAVINSLGADRLVEAIENDDVKLLASTPGLGAKGASKIILDLKGKLVSPNPVTTERGVNGNVNGDIQSATFKKLLEALTGLGFKLSDAKAAAERAVEEFETGVDGATSAFTLNDDSLPEVLKRALASLRK